MYESKLVTAKDHANREGHKTVISRIQARCRQMVSRGLLKTPIRGTEPLGQPVVARVDFGQWLADCECGGAEAVDPDEPIFYCFSCGNRANQGVPRPVVFPSRDIMIQIEDSLLERPVDDSKGLDKIDRAFRARPSVQVQVGGETLALSRSWNPGESVTELKKQNRLLKSAKEKKNGV